MLGLVPRGPVEDQKVGHQGSPEERNGRGRSGLSGLEFRGGILKDEPQKGDAPVDTKDDERPDVELGHEDPDGHSPAPEEATTPDGRDDALMSAKLDLVPPTRIHIIRMALFRAAGRGHGEDEGGE